MSGLLLLAIGGEIMLRGAALLARQFGVSTFIIGLTVIAFGTSAPELMISIQASLQGKPDIALGNVVGSNIANLLLVLGATALISPLMGDTNNKRDAVFLIIVSLGLCGLVQFGQIERWVGIGFLALMLGYSYWLYKSTKTKESDEVAEESHRAGSTLLNLIITLLGIGAIIIGSEILLSGAVDVARMIGISEAVIGLSMIAIGTSLPELAVSILAALRGHAMVAVGNIIGSNIANILLVLGATATIYPLSVAPQIRQQDVFVMLFATLFVLFFLRHGQQMDRMVGGVCLIIYAAYNFWLFYSL